MSRRRLIHLLFVSLSSILLPFSLHAQTVDATIQKAWDLLQTGNGTESEHLFQSAIEADPKSTRAYMGLSYLYAWRHRYTQAWEQFEKACSHSSNAPALFYAEMASTMTQKMSAIGDTHASAMYESMLKKGDAAGTLKAMACSRLGDRARFTGQIKKSSEYYNQINAIDQWALIGPFENVSNSGYNKVLAPEKAIDLAAVYPGRFGSTLKWFVPSNLRPDKWVDIERHFIAAEGVFYAYCSVFSPKKQTVSLRIGTSGAFKAILNDEVVLQCEEECNNDLDTYICETELQNGWNKVLLKLCVWDLSRSNFLIRIVDNAGNPIDGLQTSTDIKSYTAKPGAAVREVVNPFEKYFEEQLQAHPDYLENYIILADSYLRNDKGEKAEMTLRDALKRSPNSVLLLDKMMDAYTRNDKKDLSVSILEKIWGIDSTDLNALEYKCREALNNKNYDEAERLVTRFEKTTPEEDQAIGMKLLLLSSTNKNAQALDLIKSAYDKYPRNYGFASGMAYLALQGKRNYSEALDIWKKYMETSYTYDAISSIADIYSQMGDYSHWEEYRNKLAELSNNAPGYNYSNAKVYYGREDYDNAERMVRLCLQCCPSAADYHEMLGDIDRKRGKDELAKEHYKTALKCYPGYLKIRETIREMENKKPLFTRFSSLSIDSLVRTAPAAADYPEDESIVLLEDSKYVVYPEGTNESRFELLVRIFKQEGIDDWKELSLGSDAVIEKAVSIKTGGSELRADIDKGQMVFKSLQEGDFVYVRWREYERGTDRFFRQFNVKRYLNGKYPSRVTRASILAPTGFKLNYRVSNEKLEPNISSSDDGTLYEWRLDNQAAVKNESAMPHLDVIGKYLEVSSIDSWNYISDWYYDVTNRKPKITYEVREKVQELLGSKTGLADEEILRRVYQFITDSIRYSYVPFRQSGGTPQKARDVLITKIGDCKDVATLGIAMLSVAGLQAEYCLVKTNSALLQTQLPSRDFDHVIVRVHMAKGWRYVDFTASNYPIGSVPEPDIDAFSLLIQPGVRDAQRLDRKNFSPSTAHSVISGSVTEQGDISLQRRTSYSGALGAQMRYAFRNKGKKDNDKSITEELSRLFPNVRLNSLEFGNLDTLSESMSINESFDAPKHITDVGNFKLLKLPWFNTLGLDDAFSYAEREYPIESEMGYDTTVEEITLMLPEGLAPVDLPTALTKRTAMGEYSVSYSFEKNKLKAKRVFISASHLIQPSDYKATKEFYNSIVKEDDKQILLGAVPLKPSKKAAGRAK